MIRSARPDDREILREVQTHLREPNPSLLDYAVDGPPLTLVSTARRFAPRNRSGEERPATAPDDTPVGYLVAFHDEEAGYVAEIVVAPDHRREGRARRLLAATFDRLRDRGCSRIRLAVHPDNDAARTLYESLGFEEVGREEGHYEDGSDGIVMGRDL
ncbi:GNAT family N-acetyltransferase [Halorussus ruber]|uniref:GNAT family N-acetyltransferase n=1 Tax=Halorussus ruber TaxID=1126238 RepID=UPI001091A453|nr:GNAT family N-acetyltransferase [Halorussus ruber]